MLVIEALKNKTDAADRVYSPRLAHHCGYVSCSPVQTPIDVKNSLGRNVPQFNTVTTVRITGRLQELDDAAEDNGAEKAEEALEQLREQVERAVINSYELTRKFSSFCRCVRPLMWTPAAKGIPPSY